VLALYNALVVNVDRTELIFHWGQSTLLMLVSRYWDLVSQCQSERASSYGLF